MINRLVEKKRQEEGFTLIELLIVVIILGILAAVVVFGVSTFRKDSATEACKTDVKSVETAAEAYRASKNSYAADTAALKTGGYLREEPSDDEYTVTYDVTTATTTTTSGTPPANTNTNTDTGFTVTGDLKGGTVQTDCSD